MKVDGMDRKDLHGRQVLYSQSCCTFRLESANPGRGASIVRALACKRLHQMGGLFEMVWILDFFFDFHRETVHRYMAQPELLRIISEQSLL